MAEFKLGRIKFVWKGTWADTTPYYVDDVVNFGGKVFICVVGHTSDADFYTDLDNVPSKWNLLSDGLRWQGAWTPSTPYVVNDLVRYGGNLYICKNPHSSAATFVLGLEDNTGDWTLFGEGFEWKNNWAVSTRYKVNDLVRYGGYTYVCNTKHTSTPSTSVGLEGDPYWDVFNPGIEYKGDWSGSSVRYKLNDVVKNGAGLWICSAPHTSSTSFIADEGNWDIFVEAIQFEGNWDIATVYQLGDVVRYGGNQYIAKTNNVGNNPVTSTLNWTLYAEGFNYSDSWSVSTSYKIGDVVTVNGNVYLAIADVPSTTYTVTASTALSPYTFTTSSTTGMVADSAVVFSGTTFGDVNSTATYYVKSIPTSGTFTVTHQKGGATFHPTTATGSMTATVAAMPPNSSYWKQLVSGVYWKGEWIDDTQYVEGDAVRYGSNAYICVLAHRSEGDDGSTIRAQGGGAANSRPDLDFTGTYWNVLNVGSETSVLTTKGDIAYFGASGPTRLPVGRYGQVLRAGAEYPEWVTLGEVDHAYFVAPHGTDSPAPVFGKTWDMPWKTVRYAAQQIEKGPRNPDTQKLLELNRVFIQREVSKWIEYQVAHAGGVGIWNAFDFDEYKCERDIGFIIDRVIWDIGHGGNLKVRAAAQTYLNALGEGPFSTSADENGTGTYTKLGAEGTQDVAAYNYMLTVIEAVLNNEAPAANYQALTGDSSTAVVTQHFDTTLVAESGAMSTITSLVGIVTDALTAGVTTNLPAREVPSDVINVAPGTFEETLPIIVPAECAVVGTEVRATHVKPADSLIDLSDAYYTVNTLDRLATVVSEIATGTTVTKSAGNSLTQSQEWPYSNAGTSTALVKKINAMKYSTDFRLNTIHSYNYPSPTGYNISYLTGYGDARDLILANKEFFKEQIEAWLTANYPNLYYSRTSCKRDVGYITDALVYDLTYGGNAMTVQAGLAYYQGVGSTLFIDSTEKTATLAAYAYLRSMFIAAATNATITSLQTKKTQHKDLALSGGSAATTIITNNINEMIDIVTNGPSAETLTDPSTAWVGGSLPTDYSTMNSAVSTIQTNTIDYINTNFGNFTYNSALCRRDAGYLVDAAYYDAAFSSNFWAVQNGISYWRTQSSTVLASQREQEIGVVEYIKTLAATSLASSGTAVATSNATYNEIVDILTNGVGSANAIVYTDTGVTNATIARQQLVNNRTLVVNAISTWMAANQGGVWAAIGTSGQAACARDVGYTIDALAYDAQYGGNLATRNIMRSLFNQITGIFVEYVTGEQAAAIAAYTQLGTILAQVVRGTYAGQDTSAGDAGATYATLMGTLTGYITTAITNSYSNPDSVIAASAPSITWAAAGIQTAVGTLDSAKTTIVAEALQYITDTYSNFSYNHSKCSRDVATIIKAVGYDMMFDADFQTLKAGYAYLRATASEVFDLNQKTVTRESLTFVRDSLLALSIGATAKSRITSLFDKLDSVIYSGSNEGNVCQSEDRMVDYAILQLERNRDFIVQELDSWIAAQYSTYSYNRELCNRDTNEMIDALKWDLKYSSNYKSLLAIRYYANAVLGNKEEDFFYMRNGTGLRNMTLEGLNGDLTPENTYGTRRVTAGAYASLDPGWGPDDFRSWIISRSPYMQNCACFGYAAIGQKIDGALHNGGYQSMVSNDFTQLISDGIGAWVTNNGRAELVSVFTYYSHIGYLSENGGRIRGTNGNNSYGDFGSVAEGVDATEAPGYAQVDNTAYSAVVGHTFTDGDNQLLKFEFDNAGSDYTEATWTIAGPGTGSSLQTDEFRDDGVFQVFLLDNTDDSTAAPEAAGNYGGYGYITNSNTAQGGTSSQITIAATDSENSTAYVGMKIYLTGGTGAGQFGIIATYNSGTKVATVTKESTGAAGWDHIVPGTALTSPDASTTYTIEPRIELTAPGYTSTAATLPTIGTWTSVKYGETCAAYTGLTGTYSSTGASGATWQVVRNGWKYFVTNVSGGTGYDRLQTITIDGASLGGVSSTNDIVITITTVNSVTGAIVDFDFAGYGIGGRYVAVRSGSQIGATSEDGINWTTRTTLMPSGANWTAIASGVIDDGSSTAKVSRFMAVAGTGSATTASAWSADGITWNSTAMKSSHEWCAVAFGGGNFVAINSDSTTVNISGDGEVWDLVGTLPGTGFTKIVYGKGKFVAIGPGGVGAAYSTNNGYTWTAASLPATTNYSGLTYGNNMFIAVSSTTGTEAAYSLDGITWTAATLPASASWTDVTYGQGLFFAVSGSTQAASSEDGINWTSRTTSTAGSGFSAICFGNRDRYGLFVGVGGSSGTVATYIRTGATAKARAYVAENKIYSIKVLEPGSGYNSLPTLTITDPSRVFEAPTLVRKGKSALATPSFVSRGTGYVSATAELDTGDGYANFLQYGTLIAVKRISSVPTAGSNVVFDSLPGQTFKLVNVYTLVGANQGSQTAYYQVSPEVKRYSYLTDGESLETRIRYSQVRLTGHDFLLIGTGNFDETNYPNTPLQDAIPANETVENNGGRVFYTSTDQDGNFRVGGLFTVEQSTGIATLNADAFNIAGLQELSLGNITLGGGSATITEFSTDPFFTADSDNVVPTQRAVKAYISAQIGGGGASLNVNSVTAGSIYIAGTAITTTTNVAIAINARVNFQNAIRGYPVAWNFYMR